MSWTAQHRRGDVLRELAERLEQREDHTLAPVLPTTVPAPFHDHRDLVGALQFRWHHRLVGLLEQRLDADPESSADRAGAVSEAWAEAARSLPGLRALLDAQLVDPVDPEVGEAMRRATAKERQLLAAMAGIGGRVDVRPDSRAVSAGRELEQAARARLAERPEPSVAPSRVERVPRGSARFVRRLREVLAA
ncbi:hypothetical protein [Nocardioides mangrovicus]|nr:hypothetical protein [Nocardioides mangrovicus]